MEAKNTSGGFEGVGEIGLKWLKKRKKKQVVDGNGSCQHVKLALEYDIDVWVGARTTVNPFAMQELADALELKNCIGKILLTDLSLWLGGVERLYNAGIEN
jgi:chorismate mutase